MQYANQHMQQCPLPGAPQEAELVGSGLLNHPARSPNLRQSGTATQSQTCCVSEFRRGNGVSSNGAGGAT